MSFRPMHDRVLIQRIDADDKTAGRGIIPDTAEADAWRSHRTAKKTA